MPDASIRVALQTQQKQPYLIVHFTKANSNKRWMVTCPNQFQMFHVSLFLFCYPICCIVSVSSLCSLPHDYPRLDFVSDRLICIHVPLLSSYIKPIHFKVPCSLAFARHHAKLHPPPQTSPRRAAHVRNNKSPRSYPVRGPPIFSTPTTTVQTLVLFKIV